MRWMGEYGIVKGLSLIQPHLGFTSSWFAFSAPLVWNWQSQNIGAVSNGFIFLILIFWGLISLSQGIKKTGIIADFFAFCFSGSIFLLYLIDNVNGFTIVSFSNDVLVTFLSGVLVWYLLIIYQNLNEQNQDSFRQKLIIIILACGAWSVKLTAMPLLFSIIILFAYFYGKKQINISQFLIALALTFILVSPTSAYAIKTSGCPIYPSQSLCLDVAWTRSKDRVNAQMNIVSDVKQGDSD